MAQVTYVAPSPQASGTTFAQLQAGGLAAALDRMIGVNAALSNPSTQATATATGGGSTGGSLPAGDYYLSYTFANGFGETTAGTTESAKLTVSAGNKPRITIPSLPTGATHANIYATAAGGASGSETLFATGVTTTTYDLVDAAGCDPLKTPPTVNTTSAVYLQELLHTLTHGNPKRAFDKVHSLVFDFLSGHPAALADVKAQHLRLTSVFAMYTAILNEIGVLIAANPGTIAPQSTSKQWVANQRTWS